MGIVTAIFIAFLVMFGMAWLNNAISVLIPDNKLRGDAARSMNTWSYFIIALTAVYMILRVIGLS